MYGRKEKFDILAKEKIDTHAVIEILLLKDLGDNTWEALSRPQKR